VIPLGPSILHHALPGLHWGTFLYMHMEWQSHGIIGITFCCHSFGVSGPAFGHCDEANGCGHRMQRNMRIVHSVLLAIMSLHRMCKYKDDSFMHTRCRVVRCVRPNDPTDILLKAKVLIAISELSVTCSFLLTFLSDLIMYL